jgi:pseudouridine-5'-phosphate glycosidase/pseudouridine kinase
MCWQTDQFPAFFLFFSGEKAPIRVDKAEEVSDWIQANKSLSLTSGAIVAVPNPEPADEATIQTALDTALHEVKEQNIQGKAATPYLLQRINELTGGGSLKSNIALVKNNAKVGASIAVAHARKRKGDGTSTGQGLPSWPSYMGRRTFSTSSSSSSPPPPPPPPLIIGGATVDMIAQGNGAIQVGTSNVGTMQQSHGGVGRNITECLGRYQLNPVFLSVTGNDDVGDAIHSHLKQVNVEPHFLRVHSSRTAVYNAILDRDGALIAAIADMDILDVQLNDYIIATYRNEDNHHPFIILDGNVSPDALLHIATQGKNNLSPSSAPSSSPPTLWFEPTSVEKSIHCIPILDSISLISPNIDELVELVKELKQEGSGGQAGSGGHAGVCTVEEVQEMGEYVVQHMRGDTPSWVIVTMGERGVVLCSNEEEKSQHLLPDVVDEEMVNCTGAGDCLLATVAALRLQGSRETLGMETCVRIGMRAASMTIQSDLAVSVDLNEEWLLKQLE